MEINQAEKYARKLESYKEHDLYEFLESDNVEIFNVLKYKYEQYDGQTSLELPNFRKLKTIMGCIVKKFKGKVFDSEQFMIVFNIPNKFGSAHLQTREARIFLKCLVDINMIEGMTSGTNTLRYFGYEAEDLEDKDLQKKRTELKLAYFYKLLEKNPNLMSLVNEYSNEITKDNIDMGEGIVLYGKKILNSIPTLEREVIWLSENWGYYYDKQNQSIILKDREEISKDSKENYIKIKNIVNLSKIFFGEDKARYVYNKKQYYKGNKERQLPLSQPVINSEDFDHDFVNMVLDHVTYKLHELSKLLKH